MNLGGKQGAKCSTTNIEKKNTGKRSTSYS